MGAPPEPLDKASRAALFVLAIVAVGTSFQGSIPSASLTYAAREWGNSTAEQTRALAVIRADIVVAVVLLRLADRYGRQRLLQVTASIGPVLTAICAFSPNLTTFTVVQVFARSFVTATAVLIAVLAVEGLRSHNRTWASGVLVIAGAIGSALAVGSVAFADRGPTAWRWLFALPLISILAVPLLVCRLPESQPFLRHRRRTDSSKAESISAWTRARAHRRRLIPLCLFLGLLAFENAPSRQLQNEYLRLDRGYSSQAVALFSVLSNAPGVVGLIVGSLIGHRVSHKRMLALAIFGFAACDAGMFLSHGPFVWIWSMAGALLGAASLPILAILVAELFPTSFRSTANGITLVASRIAGAAGLLAVGLATRSWTRGTSLAATSVLAIAAVFVLPLLPETGGRDLDALNPEDALDTDAEPARS
jgi:MFS transporter, putative metabolite:H+ symporter